ncbi:serine O-acetyltransferase EpsC [Gemmatimonas sp.]|jgi:serine O-acetyltransferase|uniref:serine O-acetyltransferase EpsC n=1 Tax=Gemmatimonas sp. TaxID=1962908 RepID=UPI0031CB6827|nr:serine acetyltransferase [Gemmatimonas sp.]
MHDSSWATFLAARKAERQACDAPRPLRALAEEFAFRALALMFPQFAHPARMGAEGVDDEALHLEALLRAAIGPLVVDPDHVLRTFLARMNTVHEALVLDANAIMAGDPAAMSLEEVIVAYPGFLATAVHRIAHELYLLQVPLFPRVLSEWSHRETGIDIHPGARIGAGFAIDHGTGVVIGETSVIGDRVRIYQGVTLGALAVSKKLANRKRHPTIEHDVVIYANATILGGMTVVGAGSVIGGNVWLTNSVPPRSVVQFTSRVEQRGGDDGLEFHI